MSRVTIKSLEEQISTLKAIIEYNSTDISELNKEIKDLRNSNNMVSRSEFDNLLKRLEQQKLVISNYEKLNENLKTKNQIQKTEIKKLQEQPSCSVTKLNDRNAGRKAFSNIEVIQMIYNLYLCGKSLQGITDELNHLSIRTSRDKEWSKSSIRYILLNPKNISNGFIDVVTFERAVELLNDNRNN